MLGAGRRTNIIARHLGVRKNNNPLETITGVWEHCLATPGTSGI